MLLLEVAIMLRWGIDCVLLRGKSRVSPGWASGAEWNECSGHCCGIDGAWACAAFHPCCCVGSNIFCNVGLVASAAPTMPLGSWACGGLLKVCLKTGEMWLVPHSLGSKQLFYCVSYRAWRADQAPQTAMESGQFLLPIHTHPLCWPEVTQRWGCVKEISLCTCVEGSVRPEERENKC